MLVSALKEREEAKKEKRKPDLKPKYISHREYRLLGVMLAIVLMIIAMVVIALTSFGGKTTLSACNSIVYSVQRYNCIDNLASNTSNASMCLDVGNGGASSCIDQIAMKRDNISVCGVAHNGSIMDSCIMNFSESHDSAYDCSYSSNSIAESGCLFAIAEAGGIKSPTSCSLITNKTLEARCYSIFYYDEALKTHNDSYCKYLPSSNTTGYVNSSTLINSYPEQNISLSLLSSIYNLSDSQDCYTDVNASISGMANGTAVRNTSLVGGYSSLSNLNISDLCSGTNSSTNSSPLCNLNNIVGQASIDDNSTACLSSPYALVQYLCLISIATKYNNPNDCNYISNSSIRSICISNSSK